MSCRGMLSSQLIVGDIGLSRNVNGVEWTTGIVEYVKVAFHVLIIDSNQESILALDRLSDEA